MNVSFKHRIISLYCWPFPFSVWQRGQWFWPQTNSSSDTNGIRRSTSNSNRSNLCWCYSHFLENGFSGMIWRQQHWGDAVLSLEWSTGVVGDRSSTARSTWEGGSACVELPQLFCWLLAWLPAPVCCVQVSFTRNILLEESDLMVWSASSVRLLHVVRERHLRKNHCYVLEQCSFPQPVT